MEPYDDFYVAPPKVPTTIEEAVKLLYEYDTWQPAYGESGADKQWYFDNTAVHTAGTMLNQYAMAGGDTSAFPKTAGIQKVITPEYSQFLARRRAQADPGQTFGDQLFSFMKSPPVLIAAGGLAGMGAFSGAGSAAGTEAASTYGAGGEFGAGASTYGAPAGSIDWGMTLADSGTTMTDVSPGLFDVSGGAGAGTTAAEPAANMLSQELAWGAPELNTAAMTNSPWLGAEALPATTMSGGSGTGVGSGVGGTISTGQTPPGGYKFPYENVVGGLLSSYLAKGRAKDLQGAVSQAADRADPFYAQRPRYQAQFADLTTSPSSFFQDPAIKDIIDFQTGSTERRLAGQGYNMSGNFADEVSRTGMREAFGQYMPYSRMIGEAAGAFQGTQGAGQIMEQGAGAVSDIQGQTEGDYLKILGDIFRGQQPNAAQQAQGTARNQNLYESVFL